METVHEYESIQSFSKKIQQIDNQPSAFSFNGFTGFSPISNQMITQNHLTVRKEVGIYEPGSILLRK